MSWKLNRCKAVLLCLLVLWSWGTASVRCDVWWTNRTVEEERSVADGISYQRVLYQNLMNAPVRAHIVSVTGLEDKYVFGVLGSYGTLFPPSAFAKQSQALVTINGGFFLKNPSRATGLVVAHGKVLYPPLGSKFLGTVGFDSKGLLIDWISSDESDGYKLVTEKERWNECHAALGAGPVLLKSKKIRVENVDDSFYTTRHPRTGIGKAEDGSAFLVVIDGRQVDWSAGVTLEEFALLFEDLGAVDALNLDGGGSTVMLIGEEIVSRPSDNHLPGTPGVERAVANVISLFPKDK